MSTNTDRSLQTQPNALSTIDPTCVADRYLVQDLLGRGGMASAYHVYDKLNNSAVALKMLSLDDHIDDGRKAHLTALFEREFHTLIQLAHPRVVKVFDYGVDRGRPYYVMELLDGGDLRELSPIPWQQVCTMAYEVCSVLSLLHSRRLVHRDLTPRNIRWTADGKAKLIDFGLIAPSGSIGSREGTPQYIAPENLMKMSLDGRSDLFSLGATLYFALTGHPAFPARRFGVLPDLWRSPRLPPSRLNSDIPPAIDELVLDLIRVDVGSRPKSAAEVMDRLIPLMETAPGDELSVARAHLTTPQLIGRDDAIMRFRKQMVRTARQRGGGFLISGKAGAGRSRILDAFVLEAKLVGAIAIRADATHAANGPFGVAAELVSQLMEAAPTDSFESAREHLAILNSRPAESDKNNSIRHWPRSRRVSDLLADINRPELDRAEVQAALRAWFLQLASQRLVAIAVDDIELLDEPSASLFASLSWEAPNNRLVYAATIESGSLGSTSTAISLLQEHAKHIELSVLSQVEITMLLKSLFGDVPNLQLLVDRIYALCGGRPRDCLNLAQHLVDRGAVVYTGGTWRLPAELNSEVLPSSMEEALKIEAANLNPTARKLALMLAIGLEGHLSRSELMLTNGICSQALDKALDELLVAQMIAGSPSGYTLNHGKPKHLLISTASDAELIDIHKELSRIYKRLDKNVVAVVYHLLHGPRPEDGLDLFLSLKSDTAAMSQLVESAEMALGSQNVVRTFELCLNEAERLGKPIKEQKKLWVLLAAMASLGEDAEYYYRVAPAWLEQLKRDSGFYDWHKLDDDLDPATRSVRAVGVASERYNATPREKRVTEPTEAIKELATYVVVSIAVVGRVFDVELAASLPALLKPFAPLNPIVDALVFNAMGTQYILENRREKSRQCFEESLKRLDTVSGDDLVYVGKIRAAIYFAMADIDAALGIQSNWIDLLERAEQDPNQRVSVHYIRKVAALHQGDWEAAEHHRRQAELLSLQSKARSMFSTLWRELEVHAMACDLTGLKRLQSRFDHMATRHPGWDAPRLICTAYYARQCGVLDGAMRALEQARALDGNKTVHSPWKIVITTIELEILVAMGRAGEALELGFGTVAESQPDQLSFNDRNLFCAVALAEAKLGNYDKAFSLMERVIAQQRAIGVTGLQLGRSYEYCTRIAIWADDRVAFKMYSELTEEQYRPGRSDVLGTLYERLVEEARKVWPSVDEEVRKVFIKQKVNTMTTLRHVTQAMAGCEHRSDRAQRALALLCDGQPPGRGYLFLFREEGLALSASNAQSEDVKELMAFAQHYVEMEIDDGGCTITVDDIAEALQSDESQGIWEDRDGTRYRAILLESEADSRFYVAGVAMLTNIDTQKRFESVSQLAPALATSLIKSGDAKGALAA